MVTIGNGKVCYNPNQDRRLGAPVLVADPAGERLALGRLDTDASLDVAIVSAPAKAFRLYANDGHGSFHTLGAYPTGDEPRAVAVADLNGDGCADVISANYASRDVAILINRGDGTFQPAYYASVGPFSLPHEVAVADLNRDGLPDIVTVNANTHDLSVLLAQP